MTAPLTDRLAAAFRKPDETTSEKLFPLREELAQEVERIATVAADAENAALDPALGSAEAAQRQKEATDLAFETRRLRNALGRLGELIEEREAAEREAERYNAYLEAKTLRDRAATEIEKRYPAVQKTLAKLQQDIGRARLKVHAVNAALPDGHKPLDMPEAVAFDYPDSPAGHVHGPRPAQIAEMLVPDLNNWACPVWPPQWNGQSPGRISEQVLDGLFARGNKK
ncbi:hypothetical protein [Roseovarius ramblicola]|uniref:Chromosome partition protein Smc n=1 Tax=Roseovarius ramblicola TaxID=2022336 RepID=A0ABV5I0G6_9RHOB